MRDLHLYLDRPNNRFVQGLNAASPVGSLEVVQNTKLQIFVHDCLQNPSIPRIPVYVEGPVTFQSIRASIGTVSGAPVAGSFKLKVVDQTTGTLTWPTDLSPSGVATWKASIVTALCALSTVGAGGVISVDPPNAPAQLIYLAWTNPTKTDAISVVSNELVPWIDPQVMPGATPVGYTQIIKLQQFPDCFTTNFVRPLPPAATISESVHGATGVNEEQVLSIPAAATGSLSLTWSGASTISLDVSNITAAGIAAALNAIVPNGGTNPSFAVTSRASDDGSDRFAIVFTGPLAGAARAALVVTMVDQQASPWAIGTLDLTGNVGIEEALNGATETGLTFQLAINADGTGEDKILIPLTILADLDDSTTPADAAQAGAVAVITNTVYVDATGDTSTQIVTAAAGSQINLLDTGVAGQTYTINHGLETLNPVVIVEYRVSSVPEEWTQLSLNGDYSWKSTSTSTVDVSFSTTLSTDTANAQYIGNYRIYVYSPNSSTQLKVFQFLWSQCLQTVPGGQSVADKFAAIDAALAGLGGAISIPAARITGLIAPSQLDLTALANALSINPAYVAALVALMANSSIINAIATALASSANFVSTLLQLFKNGDVIGSLINALTNDPGFLQFLKNVITNTSSSANAVVISVPDATLLYPVFGNGPMPSDLTTVKAGGLLPAFNVSTTGSLTTLPLPAPSSITGQVFSNDTGSPILLPGGLGMHTSTLPTGAFYGSDGRRIYPVSRYAATTSYYPKDFEKELWMFEVNSDMLRPGTSLTVTFSVLLQLLNATSRAQYHACLDYGTAPSQTTPATTGENLQDIVWNAAPMFRQRVILSGVAITHQFGVTITVANDGTVTAKKNLYSALTAADAAPTTADVALRFQLRDFDTENSVLSAKGNVLVKLLNVQALIQ